MNSLQLAAGNGEVSRLSRAATQDDGVKIAAEVLDLDVEADVGAGDELDAFFLNDLDGAEDDLFFELEVGDAVGEQAADAVGALKDGDVVPGFIELRSAAKTGRAGANDSNFFPRSRGRRLGLDPAFGEGAVDDI